MVGAGWAPAGSGGIGRNLPQQAPRAFSDAVLEAMRLG